MHFKRNRKILKILVQIGFVLRSLLLRGPLASLRMLLRDRRAEKAGRFKTGGFRYKKGSAGKSYQAASFLVLDRIFATLGKFSPPGHFVDVGSGLGRVLAYALDKGFSPVTGIELDPDLAETSGKLLSRHYPGSEVTIIGSSATDAPFPPDPCTYFFFNPFGEEVLKVVLGKILAQGHPDSVFVYMNPVHGRVFAELGFRQVAVLSTHFYTEALLYKWPAPRREL